MLMVQSAQNPHRQRATDSLHGTWDRRVLCSDCKALIEIYPRAALGRDKVNCEPARGCRRLCRVAPTYELLLPMTKA